MKYIINLYVTAGKYLVPKLQQRILSDFRYTLAKLMSSDGYPIHIDQVARHLYLKHPVAAAKLRAQLVSTLVFCLDMFKNGDMAREKFKELVEDVPELAFELILAVAESR